MAWEIRSASDSAAALRVLQRWTEVVYLMGQQSGFLEQEVDVLAGVDLAYSMSAFRSVTMDIIHSDAHLCGLSTSVEPKLVGMYYCSP